MKKNERAKLYDAETFDNLTEDFEFDTTGVSNISTILFQNEVEEKPNYNIFIESKNSVIDFDIKSNFPSYSLIIPSNIKNYDVYYRDFYGTKSREMEAKVLEDSFFGPAEYIYFRSMDEDNFVDKYLDIIRKIENSHDSIGDALIVKNSNSRLLEKTLKNMGLNEIKEYEDNVENGVKEYSLYVKDDYSDVYQKNIGDFKVLFSFHDHKPTLIDEIDKYMENEYKKGKNKSFSI